MPPCVHVTEIHVFMTLREPVDISLYFQESNNALCNNDKDILDPECEVSAKFTSSESSLVDKTLW